MKLYKTSKDGIYYYFNAKKEKRYMYRHRYTDSTGKRREHSKQGFKSENAAYRSLLNVEVKTVKGNTAPLENANMTVSQWMDIWFDFHKDSWRQSTQEVRRGTIDNRIKPLIGDIKLQKLDDITYKRLFIDVLLKRLKASTVKASHNIFRIAINYAVRKKILEENEFKGIVIKNDEPLSNFYTKEELNLFLSAAKQHLGKTANVMIYLLSRTGFRRGEALGLTWNDIDFTAKTITVNKQRDNRGERPPKTKQSYRTIPVSEKLLEMLKDYRKWCIRKKFSFGKQLKDNDFIFISKDSGDPVSENFINYSFYRIYQLVEMKEITVHGLRHTHATILLGQKVPVPTVAERLGNSAEMIYQVYGHTYGELDLSCVAEFDQALA